MKVYQFKDIPKKYFSCIIQYLYSDHFFILSQTLDFFLDLVAYADYFMLDGLKAICAIYIQQFITLGNVIKVYK